eukprot:152792-Pyramimonas_sp.AAC.1
MLASAEPVPLRWLARYGSLEVAGDPSKSRHLTGAWYPYTWEPTKLLARFAEKCTPRGSSPCCSSPSPRNIATGRPSARRASS